MNSNNEAVANMQQHKEQPPQEQESVMSSRQDWVQEQQVAASDGALHEKTPESWMVSSTDDITAAGVSRSHTKTSAKAGTITSIADYSLTNMEGSETNGRIQEESEKFEWELTRQEVPYYQQGNPKFDSPALLEARKELRNHPAIQRALADIWQLFQKDKNDCVPREEYTQVRS